MNDVKFVSGILDLDVASIKDLAFSLLKEFNNLYLVLGNKAGDKANITIAISDSLISEKNLNAGKIIREISKEILGGGGGQAHFATAGGKNPQGLRTAIERSKTFIC